MPHQGKGGSGLRARCTCGHEAAVDIGSFGRPLTCRSCRQRSVVVWGIDPKSKKATPITFKSSSKSPNGFELPAGVFELPCLCGQRLYARPRETGKRVQCPVCSTWLKLEHSKDPQSLQTRIRVVKSRLNQLPDMPPAPPVPPKSLANVLLCSCGEAIHVEANATEARCPSCSAHIRLDSESSSCIVVDPAESSPSPEKRGIDEQLSLDDFA